MKEVENESRKMGLDILNKLNSVADAQYPVGYVYTQYAGQTAPALLFGGTWTDITATSLPTQIYDSGSNANGSWIRYTDGTMMQWFWDTVLTTTTGPTGALFYASKAFTFPVAFSTPPTVSTAYKSQSAIGFGSADSGISTTGTTIYLLTVVNSATAYLGYNAMGRWSSAPVYPVTLWKRTGGSLTTTTGTSVVTGIYDSGTNSNGSWIRFTDGTMMQWGTQTVATLASTINVNIGTYGWSFLEGTLALTFPVSFIDTTYSWVGLVGNNNNNAGVSRLQARSVSGGLIVLDAAANVSTLVDWHASGKWK
jgi:hypothetical protein